MAGRQKEGLEMGGVGTGSLCRQLMPGGQVGWGGVEGLGGGSMSACLNGIECYR